MNYQQAWTFLNDLQFFKIKLGLDAMTTFLDRLGNPHQNIACVHIGGTNGKGSVASTLLSILTAAGYKVALYTSPHLSNVRERFRIGDDYIPEDDFARLASQIKDVLDGEQITYFEFTTTMALLWFAEQKVDLALMEVGMGGRLDATNVITPLVSVITNVSMDHEQYLGTTLAQVAGEKAGIIKSGVPVVSGVANDVSRQVVEKTCRQRESLLYLLGEDFHGRQHRQLSKQNEDKTIWDWTGWDGILYRELPLTMQGAYQVGNASMAVAVVRLLQEKKIEITEKKIRQGLARTNWPGRLEYFVLDHTCREPWGEIGERTCFLLDGAHNPAGVEALRLALQESFSYQRLILIWAAMADKDIAATLETIAPLADHILFTRPESERSASPAVFLSLLPTQFHGQAETRESVNKALQRAVQLAEKEDLICVAGSLYLVGRARQILRGELAS